MWALLSQLLFRGQLEAGILMEGFALEFHFESGGRKLSLGKKTFNPSFLIYDEQSLSRFCLVSVFESLSPKLKNQEEGNNRRRGKLGEKSMFSCRFKKKKEDTSAVFFFAALFCHVNLECVSLFGPVVCIHRAFPTFCACVFKLKVFS